MALWKVKIGEKVYSMPRAKAFGILDVAKDEVPVGIYAIKRGNYIELMNKPMTKTQTKEAKRKYKLQGIKVYCNGI